MPIVLSDLDLLAIEIDTGWTRDARGRLERAREMYGAAAPHLALGCSAEGTVVAFGRDVPEQLAATIAKEAASLRAGTAGERPASLDAWTHLLAAFGPVEITSGPSYIADGEISPQASAAIITSTDVDAEPTRLTPPADAGWREDEWRALLADDLGPWAMAMVDGEVASICYCSRLTERAAEAGLRTEPEHRRLGLGATTTAAWASLVVQSGRIAFYSTSADNVASQRVAGRVGLRLIGWRWQILAARPRAPR